MGPLPGWRRADPGRRHSVVLLPIVAVVVGYAMGAGIGFCLGEYQAANPLVHALFLTPALTVPLCLLSFEAVAAVRSRRKKSSESVEAATA